MMSFSFLPCSLTENGLAKNLHSTKLKNRTLLPSLQSIVSMPMAATNILADADTDDEEKENLILYTRESSHEYD